MEVQSEGAKIFYQVQGSGPALVLLHPFPTNHSFWDSLAPGLSARYRVIIPDLRGHGASSAGDGVATTAQHAADIARICQAENVARAAFAGDSIGGYILFEFWREYRDRVAALVLCGTGAQDDTPETRAVQAHA